VVDDILIGRLSPEDREIGETFKRYLNQLTDHYQSQVAASRDGEADPEFGSDFEYWLGVAGEATQQQFAIILQSTIAAVIQTVRHYRQLDNQL